MFRFAKGRTRKVEVEPESAGLIRNKLIAFALPFAVLVEIKAIAAIRWINDLRMPEWHNIFGENSCKCCFALDCFRLPRADRYCSR
jgi:hypothetical protein